MTGGSRLAPCPEDGLHRFGILPQAENGMHKASAAYLAVKDRHIPIQQQPLPKRRMRIARANERILANEIERFLSVSGEGIGEFF